MAGTAKKRTMAKRMSKNNLTGQLTNVAVAAVGYIVADQINKLPFIKDNPAMANFAKLGIGVYLAMTSRNALLISAAQGAALNGAVGAGKQYGIVSGIGALGLGPGSNWNPGIAGGNSIIVR